MLTAIALGLTWLFRRMGRAPALSATHRFLPLAYVGCWTGVAWIWLRRLVPDEGDHGIARAAGLGLLVVAAFPWLRDLFHAMVFGLENRYRLGDDLRVGEVEGRLVALGPRALILRAADGTETSIPHTRAAGSNVVRLNLAVRDAPCELVLSVAAELEPQEAMRLALNAAALSPYAAPRCAPRAFLVCNDHDTGFKIRLRGFVFDREHEALYQSDVATRFLQSVRLRPGYERAT